MKKGNVLFVWVVAASLGLVLGALLAPEKRSRIWRRVFGKKGDCAEDTMDELKSRVIDFKGQVDKIVAGLPVKIHGSKRNFQPQDQEAEDRY